MAQRVAGGSQGRMNRRFLMVAVLLGALSAVLVWAKLSSSDNSGGSAASAGDVQVVVAREPLAENTLLVASALEIKSVSANSKVVGTFTTVGDAVGKFTKFPLQKGQQVVSTSVVDLNQPGLGSTSALKYYVPTGKRAMSFTASQVTEAGGLILPGDWIDVIWTCCADKPVASKTILKNIQVGAVAQTIIKSGLPSRPADGAAAQPTAVSSTNPVAVGDGKPEPDAVTATLFLTPEEAQTLFLTEGYGRLRLALRGYGDQDLHDPGTLLINQILPIEALQTLPDALKPDGYKR